MTELDGEFEFALEGSAAEDENGHGGLEYVSCASLREAGFIAAFSTRLGGVSTFAPGGLSLGYSNADSRENVDENRRRFLAAVGAEQYKLVTARQTHSVDRCVVEARENAADYKCDALVARSAGLLLGIQTADCLPVLIADPKTGALAAVHAGWRGTAGRITERTIADLMRFFGVNPRTCVAALGPAACAECYEIGPDVIDIYKRAFGYWQKLLRSHPSGSKAYLDIQAANIQQMNFCGIALENIHIAPFCTMHNNDLFFSHRKESEGGKKPVGRLLSVIAKAG